MAQKRHSFFVRFNFIKQIFKIISLSESEKSVIKLSLKIPPHLKCVATLPCEMSSVFKATIENSDSDSEIILKIGYYLMKLRRSKNVPLFWATLYIYELMMAECGVQMLCVSLRVAARRQHVRCRS